MIDSQTKPLEFDRSWQDAFGTVLASVEHGSRKRNVMILTSSELARVTLEVLAGIPFQGRLVLAFLEQLHLAPFEAILRTEKPNFVIAFAPGQIGIATHGPAILGQPSLEMATTGLEYTEPGSYPAWTNSNARSSDPQASSIAASVASSLGLPCLVCNPSDLRFALELAMQK